MKCSSFIERNGYFTGKRCSRKAKFSITVLNVDGSVGSVRNVCTQHKDVTVRKQDYLASKGRLIVEELS